MSEPRSNTTDLRLDPELKVKWMEALRSGQYIQGTGSLCTRSLSDTYQHCCLGVLAEVAGVDRENIRGREQLDDIKRPDLVGPWTKLGEPNPTFLPTEPQSHTTVQRKLAAMNDTGKSFSKIADWIEANL